MVDLKEFTLAEFLSEQNTNRKSMLPLVHTTPSANLLRILREQKISVTQCDTFQGESLAYFFYGRPAYRKFIKRPQDWELPFVLVMKSTCLLNTKRIFPFDSGAFHSGRLPSYITRFESEGYNVGRQETAIDLLVDVFFGDDSSYFQGNAKSREVVSRRNGLNVRHARIWALCALYNREELDADDRALTIELQTSEDVTLKDNIIGAVLPRVYFDDKSIKEYFKSLGVYVKCYDVYPLNSEAYISQIYTCVKEIYEKKRLIHE